MLQVLSFDAGIKHAQLQLQDLRDQLDLRIELADSILADIPQLSVEPQVFDQQLIQVGLSGGGGGAPGR